MFGRDPRAAAARRQSHRRGPTNHLVSDPYRPSRGRAQAPFSPPSSCCSGWASPRRPTITRPRRLGGLGTEQLWWLGEGLGRLLAGTAKCHQGRSGRGHPVCAAGHRCSGPPTGNPSPRRASLFSRHRPTYRARLVARRCGSAWPRSPSCPRRRRRQAISGAISNITSGQPASLHLIDNHLARALARHGLPGSIVLAAVFAVVALGVSCPCPPAGE